VGFEASRSALRGSRLQRGFQFALSAVVNSECECVSADLRHGLAGVDGFACLD
jgi:hypothetical protein